MKRSKLDFETRVALTRRKSDLQEMKKSWPWRIEEKEEEEEEEEEEVILKT